jgi:hypothetical protein
MSPIVDRLIDIDIAIPDFKVKSAIRVGANPGFILNGGALAAEIGQGHQISYLTFLTFGKIVVLFQKVHLPSSLINAVYNKRRLLARGI